MSAYIHKTTKDGTYSYDFQLQGQRFFGSTGKTTEREAKAVETLKKDEARLALAKKRQQAEDRELSLLAATDRYFAEVGEAHKNSHDTLRDLAWLVSFFGETVLLSAIDNDAVAKMVAKRRGDRVSRRKDGKRLAPISVNRMALDPLRKVLNRARDTWDVRTAKIDWKRHRQKEQGRIRSASSAEEAALMAELSRGYDIAVAFHLMTGCRAMEVRGLEWMRVDFFNREFTVLGKGGKERTLPMSQAVHDLLWAEQGHHKQKVFTFVAARSMKTRDGRRMVKGERYPLTEGALDLAFRTARAKAGVKNFRLHDARHTFATRTLAVSNLVVVQQLLGHADIRTTTMYAHADLKDMRAAVDALDAKSPVKTPVKPLLKAVSD